MTQALAAPIDWSGIRAMAVVIGVREAARRASSHLPKEEQDRFTERVMKRSSREGWIVQAQNAIKSNQAKPLSAPVRNGAETAAQHIADCDEKSKVSYASVSAKLANKFNSMDEDELIACTPAVKDGVLIADKTFGWSAKASQPGASPLLLLSISGCPSVTVQEGPAPTE